jgi:hypothetical protein
MRTLIISLALVLITAPGAAAQVPEAWLGRGR